MSQGRRILLADDSELIQKAVKRLAGQHGYEIIEARTGADVKRIAIETKPELIVLDVDFPDADGRDILAQLKADPRTQGIPVIVWSGRDTESDRKIALSLGAEDYVEKGEAQEVLTKIKRVLLRLDSKR